VIVVSDTTPIHYLILTGYADVLPQLYGSLVIPTAVHLELTHLCAPESVRQWMSQRRDWLEIWEADTIPDSLVILDRGEQEAIALAMRFNAMLLIDERRGRSLANAHGLSITGTLGVLIEAANAQMISLPEAVSKLRQTSFQISERLLEMVLGLH